MGGYGAEEERRGVESEAERNATDIVVVKLLSEECRSRIEGFEHEVFNLFPLSSIKKTKISRMMVFFKFVFLWRVSFVKIVLLKACMKTRSQDSTTKHD